MPNYKRFLILSLTFIALGITFKITLSENNGSLGIVLIAVGWLFLIIGLAKKKEADRNNKK
ncbi:MAG: hypothetical protein ABFR32_11305 [Bacteroidota bacterium]